MIREVVRFSTRRRPAPRTAARILRVRELFTAIRTTVNLTTRARVYTNQVGMCVCV